jgi:hypothetical protein
MHFTSKNKYAFILFAGFLLICIYGLSVIVGHLFTDSRVPQSPDSTKIADIIKRVEPTVVEMKKESKIIAAESLASTYRYIPLQNASVSVTRLSDLPYDQFAMKIETHYQRFQDQSGLVNPKLQRLHKFSVSFDLISRLRFNRGVTHLENQKEIDDLIDHIIQSRWYMEYMTRITANPAYEYMETRALQILITIHTAAHFFDIPFPTLFCLLFQESKFDFKIVSHTGAMGLGQLTRIGLEQIEILRQKEEYEALLQAAINHLGNIYQDIFILRALKEMGFHPVFPQLSRFPLEVELTKPKGLDPEIIRATQKELELKGLFPKLDYAKLKSLLTKVRRGFVLPEHYAPLRPTYVKVIQREYGKHLGNIYNPETNILYSAMLLRFYLNYSWKINGQKLRLRPNVKAITAVVAYNEGSRGVLSYLHKLKKDFPDLDLNRADIQELEITFTQERVLQNHPGAPRKAHEIFKHAWAIKNCSCIN